VSLQRHLNSYDREKFCSTIRAWERGEGVKIKEFFVKKKTLRQKRETSSSK